MHLVYAISDHHFRTLALTVREDRQRETMMDEELIKIMGRIRHCP